MPPESSLGRFVGELIALPFVLLKAYRDFHRQHQTPRDAELAKASHGAGVLVLLGLTFWLVGWRQAAPFAPAFLIVAGWGVLWFTTGWHRALAFFGGQRDARIITRALCKIAAGLALALIVRNPPAAGADFMIAGPGTAWPVITLCAWLLTTGLVKFLIAARGSPKLPVELPAPLKPPARDATADEAMEDMQGHGGRKTALDDREF